MFPRGNGPLVSVLIPTRGRHRWLTEAIDSIYSLAHDKSLIEFIIKADVDDIDTINEIMRLSNIIPIKTIISPRGRGYLDMHHWVNEMCAISTGDWLYLFNDDTRMTTQDWDQRLLTSNLYWDLGTTNVFWESFNLITLVTPVVDRPEDRAFMFVRRKIYEILGHYSLSIYNDVWIYTIMNFLNLTNLIDIYVDHARKFVKDQVRAETDVLCRGSSLELYSNGSIRDRLEDARKIMDYIEKNMNSATII